MIKSFFLTDCALCSEKVNDLSCWYLPILIFILTLTKFFWVSLFLFLLFFLSCAGPTVGCSEMLMGGGVGTGGSHEPYLITPAEKPLFIHIYHPGHIYYHPLYT